MAVQIFDFGDLGPGAWIGSILIEPSLLQDGGIGYLRFFDDVSGQVQMRTSSTPDGDPTDAGPALSDAWSTYAEAITLSDDDEMHCPQRPGSPRQ